MNFGSLALALVLAIALGSTQLFAAADPPPGHWRARVSTIDGLRGFLALAVIVHHNTTYSAMLRTGRWADGGHFSDWLGQGGVALFFMITAYLFWGRLIRRKGDRHWLRFYVGRVFRIGPVYLLTAIVVLVMVAAATRQLNVSLPTLAFEVLRWLSLGAFLPTEINHVRNTPAMSVTWTLHYEWLFYLALPALSLLARQHRLSLLTATLALVLPLVGATLAKSSQFHDYCIFAALFGGGMLTASLVEAGFVWRGRDRLTSTIAVLLLVTVVATTDRANEAIPVIVLSILFYLIATGTTLFGALTTRVAHRLGHISYGTYLLHATILMIVFGAAGRWVLLNPVVELSVHTAVVGLSLLAALAAHRWIELPGIRAGDQFLTWVVRRQQPRLQARPDTLEHP